MDYPNVLHQEEGCRYLRKESQSLSGNEQMLPPAKKMRGNDSNCCSRTLRTLPAEKAIGDVPPPIAKRGEKQFAVFH